MVVASKSIIISGVVVALLGLAGCGDGGQSGDIVDYDITASVVNDVGPLGALQFEIDYLGADGGFVGKGRGGGIDCLFLNGGIGAANFQGSRAAQVGMVSIEGLETPAATITCTFRTAEEISPSSFQVRVTAASGSDGRPLSSPPAMSITQVVLR